VQRNDADERQRRESLQERAPARKVWRVSSIR
jgi:hypothetical protein